MNNERSERGASMLEMMFAAAVMALALPFAYRQISQAGESLKNAAIAKDLMAESADFRNYLRMNASLLEDGELTEVESQNLKIYVAKSEGAATGFLVAQHFEDDVLRAHKVAAMIGHDAAVAGDDGAAYSGGGWSVQLPDLEPGDIVVRSTMSLQSDETAKYLYRTVLSEGELSTMKRDLSMGGKSLVNAGEVSANKLSAQAIDAYLVATPVIAAAGLHFTNGLNLNPGESHIPAIRATGDAIGFRNFWTDEFSGASIAADRGSVSQKLVVSNKFEAKSSYSRTASGFAGTSAGTVRTSYLSAETLTFLSPFGLTVSSELMHSSDPPVKLGSWTFPNSGGAGPKFEDLKLSNFSGRPAVPAKTDFSEILKEGWR
ncbi:MAG: hypothetical protein LBB08_01625 [Rickettsiales bacterium]|jgi:hypothetical protein|nr:hypothetical protein [Rickettsiales bacterium]